MSVTLSQLRLSPDQRGAIIGASGCGKSELAKAIMPHTGKLAIIDPKRMFDYSYDVEVFSDVKTILRKKPVRFVYRPDPRALNDMEAYDAIYEFVYARGKGLVYTDDMVGVMQRSRYPHFFQVCYQMGRQPQIACLASFQRPAWVPGFVMSEARKFYAFDFTLPSDVRRISEMVPGYSPELVHEPFSFAFYETRVGMRTAVPCKLNLSQRVKTHHVIRS